MGLSLDWPCGLVIQFVGVGFALRSSRGEARSFHRGHARSVSVVGNAFFDFGARRRCGRCARRRISYVDVTTEAAKQTAPIAIAALQRSPGMRHMSMGLVDSCQLPPSLNLESLTMFMRSGTWPEDVCTVFQCCPLLECLHVCGDIYPQHAFCDTACLIVDWSAIDTFSRTLQLNVTAPRHLRKFTLQIELRGPTETYLRDKLLEV